MEKVRCNFCITLYIEVDLLLLLVKLVMSNFAFLQQRNIL